MKLLQNEIKIEANEAANDTPLRNLRDIAADMMTPSQIEGVQKLAGECKKRNYKNCD